MHKLSAVQLIPTLLSFSGQTVDYLSAPSSCASKQCNLYVNFFCFRMVWLVKIETVFCPNLQKGVEEKEGDVVKETLAIFYFKQLVLKTSYETYGKDAGKIYSLETRKGILENLFTDEFGIAKQSVKFQQTFERHQMQSRTF